MRRKEMVKERSLRFKPPLPWGNDVSGVLCGNGIFAAQILFVKCLLDVMITDRGRCLKQ